MGANFCCSFAFLILLIRVKYVDVTSFSGGVLATSCQTLVQQVSDIPVQFVVSLYCIPREELNVPDVRDGLMPVVLRSQLRIMLPS